MPPVSKVTPLPTSATGASPAFAAVPAHDQQLRLALRALRHAEQRAHAELGHLPPSSTSHLEAAFGRWRRHPLDEALRSR